MSRMCEEELQLMADKCHSLQAQCQMLKEDVAWYKDQLAELQRIKLDNHNYRAQLHRAGIAGFDA